jgi:hypothetical protein
LVLDPVAFGVAQFVRPKNIATGCVAIATGQCFCVTIESFLRNRPLAMILVSHFALPALLLIEDSVWYLQWDFWVSVFTLLLAVGTIWLALETRGMRKGSDKAMDEMATHAAASARAAEKSADATRALAEIGQRAWISVKSVYVLGDLAEQNLLALRVTMLNSGNTPGLVTHIGFHYYVLTSFPESPGYHSNHGPMSVISIPPRQESAFTVTFPLPTNDYDQHVRQKMPLYVYSMIRYTDVFGAERRTLWASQYLGGVGDQTRFAATPKHNVME